MHYDILIEWSPVVTHTLVFSTMRNILALGPPFLFNFVFVLFFIEILFANVLLFPRF